MPDARHKRDYGRGYDMADALRDLGNGVHFAVVSVRLGVSEGELADRLLARSVEEGRRS